MFLKYETTLLSPFILNGKKYTTNEYTFTISSLSYQGCLGVLSNETENISSSIKLYNLNDLMMFGSFDKGIFSSKVVAVKEDDSITLLPVDCQEYLDLKERSSIPQKLEKGMFYSLMFNDSIIDNALYIGKVFFFEGFFGDPKLELYLKQEVFCFKINNLFHYFLKRKDFIITGVNSSSKCMIDENILTFIEEQKYGFLNTKNSNYAYVKLASFTDFELKTMSEVRRLSSEKSKFIKTYFLKQQDDIKNLKSMRNLNL